MKIQISIFFIANFLTVCITFAQTITQVEPGNGTLYAAIQAAKPGDVLQLTGGAEYTHSTSESIGTLNKPITIQIKPGTTVKAVIKMDDNSTSVCRSLFMIKQGGSLTLKGLEIHGLTAGGKVSCMIKFDGLPTPATTKCGTIKIENCEMHDFEDYIIHGNAKSTMQGMINDSLIINNSVAYGAKTFLGYSYVSLGYFELKNSTIYKFSSLGIKIGNESYRKTRITPIAFVDHCTFDNIGGTDPGMDYKGIIEVKGYYFPWTITNCIFSNFLASDKMALNFYKPGESVIVTVKNTCQWKCGVPPHPELFLYKDTLSVDPNYRDILHSDYTLSENSPLLAAGSDGKPIGDPRWFSKTTSVNFIRHKLILKSFNQPNPFHSSTTISSKINNEAEVSLDIFNASGMKIATLLKENKLPGTYSVSWNAKNCMSGIYFYQLKTGSIVKNRKMILY